MKYTLKVYVQEKPGQRHKQVKLYKLSDVIGKDAADRVIIKASDRMSAENKIPEVKAFFENGGRQVIVADSIMSKEFNGKVWIEAVEIDEVQNV